MSKPFVNIGRKSKRTVNMSSYQDFAALYDVLTFDVDYPAMASFIHQKLESHGIKNGLVLDLACGTGTLTLALSKLGYEMLGADLSEDMLSVAKLKEGAEGILFLNQPMDDFELYGTVDAIVCVLDSINYLTEDGALEKTMALCANYLNPGGILIFDVNSSYKFQEVLGQKTYRYETDDIFYCWDNDYDEEEKLCDLYLSFFCREENGLYRRIDEVHTQRAYSDEELCRAISSAGLTLLNRYDNYEEKAPQDKTERIVYEVKKQ